MDFGLPQHFKFETSNDVLDGVLQNDVMFQVVAFAKVLVACLDVLDASGKVDMLLYKLLRFCDVHAFNFGNVVCQLSDGIWVIFAANNFLNVSKLFFGKNSDRTMGHASQLLKDEVLRLENNWDALWLTLFSCLSWINNISINLNLVSFDVIIFVNDTLICLLDAKRADQVNTAI